ncbi:ATP-dependent nuclease [Flexibacterium corallicola]|uniref:ATP-dependent nuclease n=1 Tax=Flexibacterium corallicola TaxID=3037259 RepID=UPI00286F7E17|nr:AAA family ATPase [Pseudovibrio sp. M1P-2-3]
MSQIRAIGIKNFRSIKKFKWYPSPGLHCLIGCGDSGKTTILDAIDLCLGARRSYSFSDVDFHNLETHKPIIIRIALGDLDEQLMTFDIYGDFLQAYDHINHKVLQEPEAGLEACLAIQLKVESDLEPQWSLVSRRAEEKGIQRFLRWDDRQRISPLRLGTHPDWHMSWRKGSIFQKLTEESPDLTAALSSSARKAREDFGSTANAQLTDTLNTVDETAESLGIEIGDGVSALLDANAVSFGAGAVALHGARSVPLTSLGTGSKTLLISGLALKASHSSSITLIDEVETGLEPHRIRRLLSDLGSKDQNSKLQTFTTSHSPVVLRELTYSQLTIVRKNSSSGELTVIEPLETSQAILRTAPEAFLAKSIVICEGKSEIGFIRGIGHGRNKSHEILGVSLVDAGGTSGILPKANEFLRLGFRTAIFMDSDRALEQYGEESFLNNGGSIFKWPNGWALEDAIFQSVDDLPLEKLLNYAVSEVGEAKINDQIKSQSSNSYNLETIRHELHDQSVSLETVTILGKTAKAGAGWFKSIDRYEYVANEIIAPNYAMLDESFREVIDALLKWMDWQNA